MILLEVNHLKKVYTTRFGGQSVTALNDVSFSVERGDYVAIMGESGSGKTTLLNALAALDRPTSGDILFEGQNLLTIPQKSLAAFRRDHLGFVFQEFNLLDQFSVRDNIFLPLVLAGKPYAEMERRMMPIVERLSISKLLEKFPYELSGGQKQRTAIARALITDPALLLADEPTGALDSASTESLLKTFQSLNQSGQTILMVTHSIKAAAHAERVLFIKDGIVFHQLYKAHQTTEVMYQKISDTLTALTTGGNRHE